MNTPITLKHILSVVFVVVFGAILWGALCYWTSDLRTDLMPIECKNASNVLDYHGSGDFVCRFKKVSGGVFALDTHVENTKGVWFRFVGTSTKSL